jgi:hypothetical protein
MAKATKKTRKKVTPRPRVWKAHPDDAIRLAAVRWFTLELERLAIEIYATDKTQYARIEKLLGQTLSRMGSLGTKVAELSFREEDCPMGYYLCKDGLCSPMCDWVME